MSRTETKRLHIVHTESLAGPGGQTLRVLNEACGMINRGHQVTLFCRPETYLYNQAVARGVTSFPWLSKKVTLDATRRLRQWLKENHADVINTHSSADSWMVALAQIGRRYKVPVIRTRHMKNPVGRNLLSQWLYTKATQFIVTTGESVRQDLIMQNNFNESRIRSLPSGVDHTSFFPSEKNITRESLSLPQNKIVVGMVAIFTRLKGFDEFIEAASLLKNENFHWVLVGDVNRQSGYRQELENRAENAGLTGQITFAWFQQNVAPWLQAMDIFCLPTSLDEGVPQVILQAMLCRLPIITTPKGSIGDAIEHARTGWMVEAGDSEKLAKAISMLSRDKLLRDQLAERAYEKARSHFTQEIMLDGMEEVCAQLVKSTERA